uniref:NADH-ubiquinone oxidoreductase chain 2 n=1 Tax=Megaustenia imperator imperator TaxID=2979634 RepID=A0A977K888_9EUPU|nr:NADH dehydrogenase subunit 2 [Megaustenia imperator imperator]
MSLIMLFFTFMIILSPIICLSSSSWLIYWSGMELGFISMFPIMFNHNSLMITESAMKYFLVQSVASILMFFFGSFYFMLFMVNFSSLSLFMATLLIKLGMFPFHFWVLPVISGIWYEQMMFLLIPLKIPTLGLINYIFCQHDMQFFMLFTSFMTMIVGSILGINCSNVRSLLAASSITHSGWILVSSLVGNMWSYFSVYSFILLITLLSILNMDSIMSSLMVLSMSGLPPFLLFSVKFLVLMMMIKSNYSFFMILIPILSAVFSLNFYLKMSYSFLLNGKKVLKPKFLMSMIIMNLMGGVSLLYLLFF